MDRSVYLLRFIDEFWKLHGHGPTGTEMKSHFGWAPDWQLQKLSEQGYLQRIPGKHRDTCLTEKGKMRLLGKVDKPEPKEWR